MHLYEYMHRRIIMQHAVDLLYSSNVRRRGEAELLGEIRGLWSIIGVLRGKTAVLLLPTAAAADEACFDR